MALTSGTGLGPYEITAPIGAGGMGEVYRATDTRLDRTVAIKVLPEHLADDPQRREHFKREARAVSSLNQRTVCTKTKWLPLVLALSLTPLGCVRESSAPRHAAPIDQNGASVTSSPSEDSAVVAAYGKLPLVFEVNEGQTDPEVKFLARGSGYTLFLTPDEAVLALSKSLGHPANLDKTAATLAGVVDEDTLTAEPPSVLRMKFIGANPEPKVSGEEELPRKSNYFVGNDATRWKTGVSNYARVSYKNIYPGVDVIYKSAPGHLQFDFMVQAGADPGRIEFTFGDRECSVDADGNLLVETAFGTIEFQKPLAYQESGGTRAIVPSAYALTEGSKVSFRLGDYDESKPLVIDPTLVYSTYLGGSLADFGVAIAVDSAGSTYVTGGTRSADFPVTSGTLQPTTSTNTFFVTKLNAAGTNIVYSTFIGAGRPDARPRDIAVDQNGNAYITGETKARDFPTTPGAFQATPAGAFVTKLDPHGVLSYSTYLGGTGNTDIGRGIAVDSSGYAYVTGDTNSRDFPATEGSYQPTLGQRFGSSIVSDAFVAKLDPLGSSLVYATFLGGTRDESGNDIAIDSDGNAYVTGRTLSRPEAGLPGSTGFPVTPNAFQIALGGSDDAFVTKLNSTGSAVVYSTYFGDTNTDFGVGIAVDVFGNAHVTGFTGSADLPTTTGAFRRVVKAGGESFAMKLNPTGTDLVYSTFLCAPGVCGIARGGGSPVGIGLDPLGNAYIAGGHDDFVLGLDVTGSSLLYHTSLRTGGRQARRVLGMAVDLLGDVYLTGSANLDLPITDGAFQTVSRETDAFVSKISATSDSPSVAAISPSSLPAIGSDFTLTVSGLNFEPTSIVQWNREDRSTTFINIGQLQASILPTDIAEAGVAQVTVLTPGVGVSNAATFFVDDSPDNPVPRVRSLSPSRVIAAGAEFTLSVFGSDFVPGAIVRWNGNPRGGRPPVLQGIDADRPTEYVSSSFLRATVSASDRALPGTAEITVFNPAPGGGTSNSVNLLIREPSVPVEPQPIETPVVTELRPLSIPAGSGGLSLKVFGANFSRGRSFVQWNGNTRPTGFVSETELRAMIAAADIAQQGSAVVTVLNLPPGGGVSGPLTLTITPPAPNPAPRIRLLSQWSVAAGGEDFLLEVFGTDFLDGAELHWNGAARPTTASRSGQIQATISAADIAMPGPVEITVTNPRPGGGPSNTVTFTVYEVTILDIRTSDMIYDSHSGKIFVSRPAISRSDRNSITQIDPETGTIERSIPICSEPGRLAVSDNGEALYVVVEGGTEVRRLDIPSFTPGLQFPVRADGVDDIEVMPGSPDTVAIARPEDNGVAIYDNGIKRPRETGFGISSIEFASNSRMYGCSTGSSPSSMYTLAIDASGVRVEKEIRGACGGAFEYDDGRLYLRGGSVINPQTAVTVGRAFLPSRSSVHLVRPDSELGRSFYLTGSTGWRGTTTGTMTISAFDHRGLAPAGFFDIHGFGPGRVPVRGTLSEGLIRWGADGITLRTAKQVYLIRIPGTLLVSPNSTYFAHLADGDGFTSSMVITNPSSEETARGLVEFFNNQGFPLRVDIEGGVENMPFSVEPLGSVTLTSAGRSSAGVGSARISSSAPVSGVIRFGSDSLGLAGGGESEALAAFIVPAVRNSAVGLNTGIAMMNPQGVPIEVLLSLHKLDGSDVEGASATGSLAARGHLARFIDELFPNADTTDFQGTRVATAVGTGNKIAATAIQIGQSAGEFTTLPVAPFDSRPPGPFGSDRVHEVFFAQLANGGGSSSSIFLTNGSKSAVEGNIQIFDDNGEPLAVTIDGSTSSEIPISVPPQGGSVLESDGEGSLVAGFARVTTDQAVGGTLRFAFPGLGVAGVGATEPVSGLITPVTRSVEEGLSTAIAIASTGSAVTLTASLRNRSGQVVPSGEATILLPPNGHLSRFVQELFPEADTREFEGTLTIEADGGLIAATALQIGTSPGTFTTLPVTPLR